MGTADPAGGDETDPTLYQGLPSVDPQDQAAPGPGPNARTLPPSPLPAVVAEAMVAWVLAVAFKRSLAAIPFPSLNGPSTPTGRDWMGTDGS